MILTATRRFLQYCLFSTALFVLGVLPAWGQVSLVVNEIMFAPVGGEPEWVELVNITASEIHIRNWRIGDERSVVTITVDSVVPPGGFLVLTKSSGIVNYHADIPAPVVAIALPVLNNTGDAVRLFDPRGILVDSVWYSPSWGGTGGKSLERISATGSSLDKQNWASSVDSEGSTPGRLNSISPLLFDIAVAGLEKGDSAIRMKIVNEGLSVAIGGKASLFQDHNFDGIAEPDERVSGPYPIPDLPAGDSTWIVFVVDDTVPGAVQYIGTVHLDSDLRRENDTLVLKVFNSYPPGLLVLNEILYAPPTGGVEFVEYINTGSRPIDVSGWFIGDRPGEDGKRTLLEFPDESAVISPGGFLVVAADSSIFTTYGDVCVSGSDGAVVILNRSSLNLNNDEDDVVLFDRGMTLHDSVSYSDSWHNPALASTTGISLERINPRFNGNTPEAWSSFVRGFGGRDPLSCQQHIHGVDEPG
ncbi:MAG: lamin tail domain-containing protein [Chlorobi bacterium]|nr:lamin tail domain-containing protein [Chlorobiota bacterium]